MNVVLFVCLLDLFWGGRERGGGYEWVNMWIWIDGNMKEITYKTHDKLGVNGKGRRKREHE